jgi:hypothetical protein
VIVGALVGGGVVAFAASSSKTVKVCTTSKGVVRGASGKGSCPAGTKATSINKTGPVGKTGKTGKTGSAGPQSAPVNTSIPLAGDGDEVTVYSDPFFTVTATCGPDSVGLGVALSQGGFFSEVGTRFTDDNSGNVKVFNYDADTAISSSGTSGKNQAAFDVVVTPSGFTSAERITVGIKRQTSTCAVFGQIVK